MNYETIQEIVGRYPKDGSSLIQILLDVQRNERWIQTETLEVLSRLLEVPLSRIQQIVTFYKAFSLVPKGRHEIHVCTGTACHVRGAPRVLDALQDSIGINAGETDPEYRFTLQTVGCVGCCALGPVMVVDGEYHGKMSPARSKELLRKYE